MEGSDDVPNVLSRIAKFSTSNTGAQTEVADADGIILNVVCKVVVTFRHSTHKNADALFGPNVRDVVCDAYHLSLIAEGNFAAIRWEMIGNWVFYNFEKFFL